MDQAVAGLKGPNGGREKRTKQCQGKKDQTMVVKIGHSIRDGMMTNKGRY